MGVTAVLNAAQGSMTDWNYVNTKDIFYTGVGMEFLGIPAIDLKWYPICNHFEEASNFIQSIVSKGGTFDVCLTLYVDHWCNRQTALFGLWSIQPFWTSEKGTMYYSKLSIETKWMRKPLKAPFHSLIGKVLVHCVQGIRWVHSLDAVGRCLSIF